MRIVNDLLNAVDIGGERCDDNAFVAAAENVVKRFSDLAFRHGKAGTFGIGGFAEHGENALFAEFAETGQIDDIALNRCEVDFEVAGADDSAGRAGNGDRAGIGNRVIHTDKFGVEKFSQINGVAGVDLIESNGFFKPVFDELAFDDTEREKRSVNRDVQQAKHIGQGANVIFMPVC